MAMKGPNYKAEFQDITQMYQFELKNKFFLQLPEEYGKRVNLLFQKK